MAVHPLEAPSPLLDRRLAAPSPTFSPRTEREIRDNEVLREQDPREDDLDEETLYGWPFVTFPVLLRHYFRPFLQRQIHKNNEFIFPLLKKYQHPVLDRIFVMASFLGSEEFYTVMIPLLLWFGQPTFVLPLILLFGFTTYGSNALKNALRLPRPPAKFNIERGYKQHVTEYGFPSTHAANAVALPFFCLWGAFRFVWYNFDAIWGWKSDSPQSLALCYTLCVLWMTSIVVSRIYVGDHSIGDVQGGLMIGGLCLHLWMSVGEDWSQWLMTSPHTLWLAPLCGAIAIGAHPYPRNKIWTTNVCLVATLAGITLGASQVEGKLIQPLRALLSAHASTFSPAALVVATSVVLFATLGLLAVAVTIHGGKRMWGKLFQRILKGSDPAWVDLFSRVLAYGIAGWMMAFVLPWLGLKMFAPLIDSPTEGL